MGCGSKAKEMSKRVSSNIKRLSSKDMPKKQKIAVAYKQARTVKNGRGK